MKGLPLAPSNFACLIITPFRGLAALVVLLLLALPAQAEDVTFKVLTSGASAKFGGYMPQRLTLSTERPPGLKKLPDGLSTPLFGTLSIGPKESPTRVIVILDEPDNQPARLFVDSNGDGDLSDVELAEWKARPAKGRDGAEFKQYSGGATLKVKYSDGLNELHLAMYRFDKNDPQRKALKDVLLYYRDYATTGDLLLGGKRYPAMLGDDLASGDFRGHSDGKTSGIKLLVDLNGDGKFDRRAETFDSHKPFTVSGTTYELAEMSPSGTSFKVIKSSQTVPEIAPLPNLSVGQKVVVFEAKTTDGTPIKFPSGYTGKLVLLDFWATWCGPCIAELPNLTKAYNDFHAKGLEVLGVSLDRENAAEKLADFTKQKNMPWPQIYDGKFWKSAIAELYGVDSIPRAFLVDGTTGRILATEGSLRGANLSKTIERALAGKQPLEASE